MKIPRFPESKKTSPPVVLVHGSATCGKVWRYWQEGLEERGWESHAIDLRGHGENPPMDLSRTTMQEYREDLLEVLNRLDRPPVLIGWSMGGLLSIMLASEGRAAACIGLAPTVPARKINPYVKLREGEFGPETFGIQSDDPDRFHVSDLDREEKILALSCMGKESLYARDQRTAGIVIDSVPCPLMIVTGTADIIAPEARYDGLHLPAERLSVPGASHIGLVLSRRSLSRILPAVTDWLERNLPVCDPETL